MNKLLRHLFIRDKILVRESVMDRYSGVIEALYRDAGITKRVPAPLDEIAKFLGYTVYDFRINKGNENVSGAVLYESNTIVLNPKESLKRRRFTLAHELGHIVLRHQAQGRSIDMRNDILAPARDSLEWDANEFAAELLMPAEDFKQIWDLFHSDDMLASFFLTSHASVIVRKERLGLH
ncbi:MAG: ImmA/IrrE family metallo-endopeptidase [Lachnospiraceae bacterium]|nr:ImmA/IrrE family metallo-endopeptidase [Lachnospiraceae bacterium]